MALWFGGEVDLEYFLVREPSEQRLELGKLEMALNNPEESEDVELV